MIGVVILLVLGVVGLVVGFVFKRRVDAMSGTATVGCADLGSVAGADEAAPCEVVGSAEAGPEELVAPLSGTPCVWYRTTVSRRYREERRGKDGNGRSVTRSRVISQQKSSAPFAIRDSSGVTSIRPEDANVIGESETVDRFEPYGFGQGHGSGDSLTGKAVAMGLNILAQSRDEGTIGYQYREWVLREGSTLYVRAGAKRDHTGQAWLEKPANGPFLISTRSEAELTRTARLTMFLASGVGAAAIIAGAVWGALLLT